MIKYLTIPQVRHYTMLWNANVRKKQQQPETCMVINDTSQSIVYQRDLRVVGSFINTLLQICVWICFEIIFKIKSVDIW